MACKMLKSWPPTLMLNRPWVGCFQVVLLPFTLREAVAEDGSEVQSSMPKELDTSPLIEELKRRTAANKEKNAAFVKQQTASMQGGVYDEKVREHGSPARLCVCIGIVDQSHPSCRNSSWFATRARTTRFRSHA